MMRKRLRDMLWWLIRRSGKLLETVGGQVIDLGEEPAQPALDALQSGFEILAYFNPRALQRVKEACTRYVLFDQASPEYRWLPSAAAATFPNSEEWVSFFDGKAATRWWTGEKAARRYEKQLVGESASGLQRWLARRLTRWATRNHPTK